MATLIKGAKILDATRSTPLVDHGILIEDKKIQAIRPFAEFSGIQNVTVIDALNQFAIPGLLNANVHLYSAISIERLARHWECLEAVIFEAAQVALKGGVTTVFDTWGPRAALTRARDQINRGEVVGSRIFCGGNIIGFDGPFSADFLPGARDLVSASMLRRVNSVWAENVGRHLMWLTPDQVKQEVRRYIGTGVDFLKYAANDHYPGAFLAFSPRVQAAIVEEAHRAKLPAQAHTQSVEGLHSAIAAGCNLIQHVNLTGPTPIPEETLSLLAHRQTGAVVFPFTKRRLERFFKTKSQGLFSTELIHTMYASSDLNVRRLIEFETKILLANDGSIAPPELSGDPMFGDWCDPDNDNLFDLGQGHFHWLRAMEEKGYSPAAMLRAATLSVAESYGKEAQLGTLEEGKAADILLLEKSPLDGAESYRSIKMIIKEGKVVDTAKLPSERILTEPLATHPEEALYRPFLTSELYPPCLACRRH